MVVADPLQPRTDARGGQRGDGLVDAAQLLQPAMETRIVDVREPAGRPVA